MNRTPTAAVHNVTPEEKFTDKKPDLVHLKVFGCIAYVHVLDELRTKLDPKAEKCIFIGYSLEQKGYKCYNPVTRHVRVSRDVVFDEMASWYADLKHDIGADVTDKVCPQRPDSGTIARAAPQNPQANQRNNQRGGRNGGRGRGRGARRGARAFAVVGEPTLNDEEEERATLFTAIDNPGARQQYAVIQITANHQGEKFELLIDCGSTHSFLSPKCLRKLGLNQ
ncbi:hypothetical protein L7F22_020352 [Adiantum nelumboides]|nr:hypothetical protein [Adiantum nelumboides]